MKCLVFCFCFLVSCSILAAQNKKSMDSVFGLSFGAPAMVDGTRRFQVLEINNGGSTSEVRAKFGAVDYYSSFSYEKFVEDWKGKPFKPISELMAYRSGCIQDKIGRRGGTYVLSGKTKSEWIPKKLKDKVKPVFEEFYFVAAEYGETTGKLVRIWIAGRPPIDDFLKKNEGNRVGAKDWKSVQSKACSEYQRKSAAFLRKNYNVSEIPRFSPKNPTGTMFEIKDGRKARRIEFWHRSFDWTALIVITDIETEKEEHKFANAKDSSLFGGSVRM